MGNLEQMKKLRMKKALKYSLISVLALAAVLLCAGYYMLGFALKPEALVSRSRNIAASLEYMHQTYPEVGKWIDSLQTAGALYDRYIENEEGTPLHALYVPAADSTNRTAVIVHGYTDNSIRMLMIGYLYSRQLGYNILLPDLYGHGLSGGTEVQMGWKDRLDVLLWTDEANHLFGGNTQMVVHGISMGAATTMCVAGEVQHGVNQQPFIKCFVEDCGYTSAWDEFKGELKNQFHLPSFPLLNVASALCNMEYGWSFQEASPLKQVKKCTLPMFFIHGDADTFVPTWMVHPLYEAKPQPKELWIVPGAEHAVAYKENPEEYTRKVSDFVSKYIH